MKRLGPIQDDPQALLDLWCLREEYAGKGAALPVRGAGGEERAVQLALRERARRRHLLRRHRSAHTRQQHNRDRLSRHRCGAPPYATHRDLPDVGLRSVEADRTTPIVLFLAMKYRPATRMTCLGVAASRASRYG